MLNAFKESFNIAQLSTSQHQAVITLIVKKERNKRLTKNWRPISLMNVDAKIASKALATRMKNVLSSIIKSDQTAYVAGRYIEESIHLISDILEYVDENELSGILFSADFEKVFDSIEHPFIFAALQSFGFGPELIQWVRLKGVESCVLNNGHSTGYFPLERGTGQGDPPSAYLFILYPETSFIQIRDNDNIRGIGVGGHKIKLSTYFLTPDTESLDHSEGGYKDVDIATKISALKVPWITRLLDDNFQHWKVIPNLLFLNAGGLKTSFRYNLKLSKYCRQKVSRFPKFHNELVQIWSKVSEKDPSQAYDISNEVLWNNCMINI